MCNKKNPHWVLRIAEKNIYRSKTNAIKAQKQLDKVYKSETPQYINEMFNHRTVNENLPLLRSNVSSNFITPRPNREIFKQSITYSGPIVWNSLPSELKNLDTVNSFHNHFIKWLKS